MEQDTGILIKQINDVLVSNMNNDLKSKGLTLSQVRFLSYLNKSPEPVPFKELESHFHVSQPTVVGIINRLLEKGFISISFDEKDRRVKKAAITRTGKTECEYGEKRRIETEEFLVRKLTTEQKQQLNSLLKVVYDNLINS